LKEIIRDVDLVLIMSVNPGFGGQSFIPATLTKLRETADLIKHTNPEILLEVDGGIDSTTVDDVVRAGANVLVAGNFVFGSNNIPGALKLLHEKGSAAEPR
jgi:ribulose-phosphate 3-epimerase